MVSLDVENETQKKQIQELEQFVILLSSALTQEGGGVSGTGNVGKLAAGSSEANLIKQFASQFNMNIDNINKTKN